MKKSNINERLKQSIDDLIEVQNVPVYEEKPIYFLKCVVEPKNVSEYNRIKKTLDKSLNDYGPLIGVNMSVFSYERPDIYVKCNVWILYPSKRFASNVNMFKKGAEVVIQH